MKPVSSAPGGAGKFYRSLDVLEKAIKIGFLVFCACGFLYQMYNVLTMYCEYPTTVDLMLSNPESVKMPAVTVCDQNGILVSKFCKEFKNKCTSRSDEKNKGFSPLVSHMDLPNMTRREIKDLGPEPIMIFLVRNISQTDFDELIIEAEKRQTKERFNRRWIGVASPRGVPNTCYVVNSLWRNHTAKPASISRMNGLYFWLITRKSDNFNPGHTPTGFQISVHDPRTVVNPLVDGFTLQGGRSYHVYVKQTVRQLLPVPYATNCYDYEEAWMARRGEGPLSAQQCVEECLKNITKKKHGCYRDFISTEENEVFCHNSGREESEIPRCQIQCPPACNSVEYRLEIEEQGPATGGVSKDLKSVQLHILFTRLEVMTLRYKPKFQGMDLMNYIGGAIGFWLGVYIVVTFGVAFFKAFLIRMPELRRVMGAKYRKITSGNTEFSKSPDETKLNNSEEEKQPSVQLRGWLYWNVTSTTSGNNSLYPFPDIFRLGNESALPLPNVSEMVDEKIVKESKSNIK